MAEIFTLHNPRTNQQQRFTEAQVAGRAFFSEDRADRPSVMHSQEDPDMPGGRFGRIIAGTEVHATYENGETRYVKTLPHSHKGDDEFRSGFMEALEKSVKERLQQADWVKAWSDTPNQSPKLDNMLSDDLNTLSRLDGKKAIQVWRDNVPTWAIPPKYIDPALTKEASSVPVDIDLEKFDSGTNVKAIPKTVAQVAPELIGDYFWRDEDKQEKLVIGANSEISVTNDIHNSPYVQVSVQYKGEKYIEEVGTSLVTPLATLIDRNGEPATKSIEYHYALLQRVLGSEREQSSPANVQDTQKRRQGEQEGVGKMQASSQPENLPVLSEKAKLVAAIAAEVLAKKVSDPNQRHEIMKDIHALLKERDRTGKAPTMLQQPEKTLSPIERNAERTR